MSDFIVWECELCGFVYDEAKGAPEDGLAPGTRWADVPDSWSCPDCGAGKADFAMRPKG
ncbi:MAG: rubredoxin [Acetobacteraceae bacterium]|nr:rubredoxin [Acetobacteraceae bacterium]